MKINKKSAGQAAAGEVTAVTITSPFFTLTVTSVIVVATITSIQYSFTFCDTSEQNLVIIALLESHDTKRKLLAILKWPVSVNCNFCSASHIVQCLRSKIMR